MDYEKAYNDAMARLELVVRTGMKLDPAYIFPELAENEDERIRKVLINYFKGSFGLGVALNGVGVKDIVTYLEKQKEKPKNAISIPADCTSDAKGEDRWHKVGDSLPDNPREVLCKDEGRDYFIGRYYVGEGWEISNYDGEDKPHRLNPPVSKWIDFPSEKQKEQKPAERFEEAREKYQVKWSEEDGKIKKAISYAIAQSTHADNTIIDGITKDEALAYLYRQDSTKWSDEDEYALLQLMSMVQGYEKMQKLSADCIMWSSDKQLPKKLLRFLKSLRPQPIQLKEAYKDGFQTARHAIVLTFVNFLDENRPEGKMGLSNSGCEDIDKAFKEGDWAKIMRYAWKYSPPPKQEWSEEDEKMFWGFTAYVPNEELERLGVTRDDILKKLKSLRPFWKPSEVCYGAKGDPDPAGVWKPSEEQMNKLRVLIHGIPDDDDVAVLKSLYEQLKKLM